MFMQLHLYYQDMGFNFLNYYIKFYFILTSLLTVTLNLFGLAIKSVHTIIILSVF